MCSCSYLHKSNFIKYYLGILLRNGYWYDIGNDAWAQRRFPPYANVVVEPDAVWSFRGKPTVFGSTVCDGEGNCKYTGVEQYDVDMDKWIHLGELTQTRTFHDVVEVPVSFCEYNDNPLYQTNTAVMIIGGATEVDVLSADPDDPVFDGTPLDSVEIFGCPGVDGTIEVDPFPYPVYLHGMCCNHTC